LSTPLPPALHEATRAFAAEVEDVRAFTRRRPEEARGRLAAAAAVVVERARELERAADVRAVRAAQAGFRALLAPVLAQSWIMQRSITKPRGYPGDHALLDAFYTRRTASGPVGRLLDELVLDCAAGRAVVDRKRYVAAWLGARLALHPEAKVADIACGPCRLERDLLAARIGTRARFVAMDGDDEALAYARRVLEGAPAVRLWHENAIRIARDPQVPAMLAGADWVVSLGLLDYLPDRLAARLLLALRRALRPGGEMLVGNFAADNPSRTFMEWFGDWPLIHRSEDEFLALFEEAGFAAPELGVEREAPGGAILLVTARAGEEHAREVTRLARGAAAA
jgi:SAM-dependent methyltransferase